MGVEGKWRLLMGWQVVVMWWMVAEMAVIVCRLPHCGGQVGEQRCSEL